MTSRAWMIGVLVVACSGEGTAPGRAPAVPSTATVLANTFAPDLVGKIVPVSPRAGDYAMALAMKFQTYPSMEMQISEWRTGAVQMTLAKDGTARACLGSRGVRTVMGQYHYEPPERRQPATRDEYARLVALAGRWQVVDGVARIHLDHVSRGTCDLAKATKMDRPFAELRCVASEPTDRIPAGSLVCEASEQSQLLDLGMPMTAASRSVSNSPIHPTPAGRNLVLGAPGVVVDVGQGSRETMPKLTFRAGVVRLAESDYETSK